MSVAFPSARPRSKGEVTQQAIQKVKEKSKFRLDAARLLGVDGSVRLRRWRRESNPCGEYQEKWQLVCYSRPKV